MTPRIRRFDFEVQVEEPVNSGNFNMVTCTGTLVRLPGWEEFNFVYHKFLDQKKSRITELSTGVCVVDVCKNKTEGIKEAVKILESLTGGDRDKLKRKLRYYKDNKLQVKGYQGKWLNQDSTKGRLL